MESSLYALLLAIFIDTILFSIFFGFFVVYRRLRSRPLEVDIEDIEIKEPYINESRYDVLDIFRIVKNMQDMDFFKSLGEWGYLYLVLHRYMQQIFYSNLIIGVGVLGIIYACGTSEVDGGLDYVSIEHVIDDDYMLIAPAFCIFIFSFVIYYYIYSFYQQTLKSDFSTIANLPQEYTVYMTNIPKDYPPDQLSEKLFVWFRENYGKGVRHVYVVPNYFNAYELFLEYDELAKNLKFYLHELETKQIRPRIWVFDKCPKKVDAIDYTRDRMTKLYEGIEDAKAKGKGINCGACFVVCGNKALARELSEPYIARNEELHSEKWKKRMAPAPSDIKWENIGLTAADTFLQRLFYNTLFIVLFLGIFTETAIERYTDALLESFSAPDWLNDILILYIPSLLLLFYQQVILPEIVDFLIYLEKHDNNAEATSSAFRKYLFYLIFYVFFYPLLGLEIWEIFEVIFDVDKNWNDVFADGILDAGEFFIIFMVHQAFIKNGLDLLVLAKYAKVKARMILATTSIESALAYQADDFRFPFEFAVTLNTYIIAATLSIVYPFILLPAALFFFMRYIVHKHNLLCVFFVNKSSSAISVLFLVLVGLSISAYFMQISTASTMYKNNKDGYLIFNAFMNCFTVVLFIALAFVFYSLAGKGRSKSYKEEEEEKILIKVDPRLYEHPLDTAILEDHRIE
ncbi:TMEM63A_1 [Blepharisma stoltei]|uniref:Uncharacterized protein n=1 Tax=Blepharisma stoltei TaxID=1481888 RepID=A0AAU9K6X8_9CILI|nr:unnamed protein product [Blepharisma stoltei]